MGQKINAQLFRIGVNKKNWELKYLEKNNEESSFYLYKTIEIQQYLNRFFGLYKIKIRNSKIFFSSDSMQIFISFYTTEKTIRAINKINRHKKITNYQKKITPLYEQLKTRKNTKKNILNSRFVTKQELILNNFKEMLLESLTIFTKRKININITFQNLNATKQLSSDQKKKLTTVYKQLRKFSKNSFYKEAINILFISMTKRNSAKLLAEFLSDQFRLNQLKTDQISIGRKDNYFLNFMKQSISLLIKSTSLSVTGIKIVIKGRFNKAPRAKTVIMQFGKFSLQSFESKIDYYQSTAYTSNGTFGVKVWICEN